MSKSNNNNDNNANISNNSSHEQRMKNWSYSFVVCECVLCVVAIHIMWLRMLEKFPLVNQLMVQVVSYTSRSSNFRICQAMLTSKTKMVVSWMYGKNLLLKLNKWNTHIHTHTLVLACRRNNGIETHKGFHRLIFHIENHFLPLGCKFSSIYYWIERVCVCVWMCTVCTGYNLLVQVCILVHTVAWDQEATLKGVARTNRKKTSCSIYSMTHTQLKHWAHENRRGICGEMKMKYRRNRNPILASERARERERAREKGSKLNVQEKWGNCVAHTRSGKMHTEKIAWKRTEMETNPFRFANGIVGALRLTCVTHSALARIFFSVAREKWFCSCHSFMHVIIKYFSSESNNNCTPIDAKRPAGGRGIRAVAWGEQQAEEEQSGCA